MKRFWLAAMLALPAALPGSAQAEERPFCPDRPGLNTPACTTDPGRLVAELGTIDWTRQNDADARTDTVLAGDLALRYGLDARTEFLLAWTAWGHVRTRDKVTGRIASASSVGDVTIGIKRNLAGADGNGFALALMPTVSLPAGGAAIGAGDWGAGLQVPVSVPLGGAFALAMTPEIDAAVNAGGHGRHLAWGSAAGIAIAATQRLNLAIEAQVIRDDDPAGASTTAAAGLSAGWMLGKDTQVDLGGVFGLNHATPGLEIYAGIARRF